MVNTLYNYVCIRILHMYKTNFAGFCNIFFPYCEEQRGMFNITFILIFTHIMPA